MLLELIFFLRLSSSIFTVQVLTIHSGTSIISIAYLPFGVQQHRNHIEILIYRPTLLQGSHHTQALTTLPLVSQLHHITHVTDEN